MNDEERIIDRHMAEIEERLDEWDSETALRLAQEALDEFPDVADLHALLGDALWQLEDPYGANEAYERALELLPDAADLLGGLARIRFSLLDFFGARRFAKEALKGEERAEALDVLSRLADRSGRIDEADRLAARASRIDAEEYPMPFRISEKEFLEAVEEAVNLLPERFRAAVREKNVAILVEPVPTEEILREEDPPTDPEILGFYRGIPLTERGANSQQMPDTIHLFHHNIERAAKDRKSIVKEIATTVYHEIGHFFGFREDEMKDLGLE